MANKDGHRRFGNVRKLPSGRFQIRYPGPDGRLRTGTDTYPDRRSAGRALSLIEGQLLSVPKWSAELRDHLDTYVGTRADDLVFTGTLGGVLRRGN